MLASIMTMNNGTTNNGLMYLINGTQQVNMISLSNLDDYSTLIKVLFTCVNIPLIAFSLLALVALNRTKRTPKNARFLSSVLITMDVLAVIGFTVRKFIDDNTANMVVQVISVNFAWLAYLMVGIMCLERLIVFTWPNFYIRIFTVSRVKEFVVCILLLVSIIYYFVRIGVCYLTTPNFTWFDVIGSCNKASFTMIFVGIFGVIVSSIVCYINIYRIVRMEHIPSQADRFKRTTKSLQRYKSTTIVFVYLLVIISTSITLIIILSLGLNTKGLQQLLYDIVNTINCMLDTCLYVLWFRECRMEILKIASYFCPGIEDKIERMRLEIFHVVTTENRTIGRTQTDPDVDGPNNGYARPCASTIDFKVSSDTGV